MTDVRILDPLTFPLQGQQLIEASAGTGKTYTITALYLRLLLGLGNINDKPLGPDQILVVTFTEAATEELRDRIRQRIVDARNAFLGEENSDPFLQALAEQLPDMQQAITLLEQAIRQMDEAAIFTIHGFCQRMLKRHAFESGSLFETELTQDDQSLIRHAVLDFWRHTVYPLSSELTDLIWDAGWTGPDKLMLEIRGLLSRSNLRLQPDYSDTDLAQAYQQRKQQVNAFKAQWLANEDDLFQLIQDSGVNKRSYSKAHLPKWLLQISNYSESSMLEPAKKLAETMQKLTQSVLLEKTPKGQPPEHPLFVALEQLLAGMLPVKQILLAQALKQVGQRLSHTKQQQQLQTFDDLLNDLHRALEGPRGHLLAAAIKQQFPIALIDEFQDTDPVQYGIFSALYADPHDSALVMIGDPKQAIYAFRGADIFTYIQARRAVAAPYTLDTNWRSTQAMVESVNQLFQSAESAFIYDQDIPFVPVKAADKGKKQLRVQKRSPAALTFWNTGSEEPLSKSRYTALYAQATAAEIDRLLGADVEINQKPLIGSDIAVLVRNRHEAEEIRRALEQYEHPCVYLSNQDSVFNSVEAIELSLVLQAIENAQNEGRLKAALATDLLHYSALELDRFNHDEQAWEQVVAEFSEYHEIWLRQGIQPALRRLLQQRDLAQKILQRPNGERCLTNLLHLSELLQQASAEVEGMAGLIRWFNEQVAQLNNSDEQILRLESERNLVTIVTIHKSKGLEYPIVFLPFASSFREDKSAFYHDDQGDVVLDLDAGEEALAEANKERLAEELRLLYVALTRSVYRCYVGVNPIKIGNSRKCRLQDSAIGHLLLQGDLGLNDALAALQTRSEAISVEVPPQHATQTDLFSMEVEAPVTLQARQFSGKVDRNWRVSSYSALSKSAGGHLPVLPGLDLEVAAEQTTVQEIDTETQTIFTFPKGANAGTYLHSVFEEISFPGYLRDRAQPELQTQLSEQLLLAGYDSDWAGVIDQLIIDVLNADLDGAGLTLGIVEDQDRLVEMEFMLTAQQLKVAELETLIRQHDPLSAQAKPLAFEPLQGMLKGFIDLLFRHEGRYYVLDYKSNYLGAEPADYHNDALVEAMADHRYDLQYLIYVLAVHRLLQQRLVDYDYERDFGGVFYLFLRGMQAGEQQGVFHARPSQELIEGLDRLFDGERVDV